MSHTKPRNADPVRLAPRAPMVVANRDVDDGDRTSVDVRPAPSRRGPHLSPAPRLAKPSTPPANVIPFTKPRAIAAIAASNPGSVAMSGNRSTEARSRGLDGGARLGVTPARHGGMSGGSHAAAHAIAYAQPAYAPPVQAPPAYAQPAYAPPAYAEPAPAPPPPAQVAQPLLPPQPIEAAQLAQPALPAAPVAAWSTVAQPANRWAVFERLGLGAPKLDAQRVSKWLVTAYRLLGFLILTIIVIVLVGYIATTAFFYVSDSWVVPMAVTSSDERVVSLQAQLSTQQGQRDRIADELNQAERAIVAQQVFQAEFAKAIRGDLEGRKAALERVRALATTAAGTRASIVSQNRAYAGAARKRMKQEYAARMIDRDAMLSGKFQLAQISNSNLSLAERQAEFETRAAELEATTRSLDAILNNNDDTGDAGLSYDVLQIKQQYEASRLELAKAAETRDSLKASLARQDLVVASLRGSAYLRAIEDGATVAFVPYGNLAHVKPGESLYACKLTMVFCYHVGEVIEVIDGEVQFRHPHRDKNLRGKLVELKLDDDDAEAGMEDHLFVGGKPFLL